MIDRRIFSGDALAVTSLGRPVAVGEPFGEMITDEELTDLALQAETVDPRKVTGVAIAPVQCASSSLSDWYMPAIASQRVKGWRFWVMVSLVGVLLVLEALGLCSVFGQVVIG